MDSKKKNQKKLILFDEIQAPFDLPPLDDAETFPDFIEKSFKELEPLENYLKIKLKKSINK